MASHGISWVPGTHVRFGDLDFIVTVGGELALAQAAIQPLPSIDLDYGGLERQLGVSLGPQPSREDPRCLNLSPKHSTRSAPMALSFDLRNAAVTVSHLMAQRTISSPANNEFVGMIESVTESLHGLLAEGPGSNSSSDSGRGSHHPSRECFMVGTPEGHVESVSMEEATPAGNLGDKIEGETVAPPRVGVEQLRARKREINKARQCSGIHGGRSGDRTPRRR